MSRAVDGVSFSVAKGETLGIVGESGCGKSTTARLLMRLIAPDAGEVVFDGDAVGASRGIAVRDLRRQMQMVFQDSHSSLNPRLTIEDSIAFGQVAAGVSRADAKARAREMLGLVGLLPSTFAERYPHELSGGQRQRVNIARALALEPRLVILDESVSALDKSVEAQVLNLLDELKRKLNLTYIFISHDLNVVQYISDRVLVMYRRQGGGGRTRRGALRAASASLYGGVALVPSEPRSAPAPHRAAALGRPAESHRSAVGLPLPHALRARRGPLRGDRAGARARSVEASGRMPCPPPRLRHSMAAAA